MSSQGSPLRLLISVALWLAGCGGNSRTTSDARVVSLVPSVTEIIFALGAGSSLAGTTNQCDYPEAALRTLKVGDFAAPDVERIAALKPEVVFITLPLHATAAEKLRESGIRTCVSQPEDVVGVLAEIERIGVLVGKREQGLALARSLAARLDSLPVWSDTPRVYVEISSVPLMTVGGRTFVADIVRRAGGRNVFDDAVADYPVVAPEEVAARNPDVIIVLHPGTSPAEVAQRLGWQEVVAIKTGCVFSDIDGDLLLRPGPRAVDGVLLLASRLHRKP
ncbi:MAG: cobalamin-binding protein [candidate division WOR-3 bacterium]